jgi:hypothetical protein
MQTITFSQEKLQQLKDAYAVAVTEGRDQFTFEGHELLTSYAKYLIEYLTLDKLAFQLSWRTNND